MDLSLTPVIIEPDFLDKPISKVAETSTDFIIYGVASADIVDLEGDKITEKALQDGLPHLFERGRISLQHTDILVGKILPEYSHNNSTYKTEVKDGILWVAANIYGDNPKALQVRKDILNGKYRSFSISGSVDRRDMQAKTVAGKTFNEVPKICLSAVALCEQGMNQIAKFEIIKKSKKEADTMSKKDEDKAKENTLEETLKSAVETLSAVSKQMTSVTDTIKSLSDRVSKLELVKQDEKDEDEKDDKDKKPEDKKDDKEENKENPDPEDKKPEDDKEDEKDKKNKDSPMETLKDEIASIAGQMDKMKETIKKIETPRPGVENGDVFKRNPGKTKAKPLKDVSFKEILQAAEAK